jgi:hypothetical protein
MPALEPLERAQRAYEREIAERKTIVAGPTIEVSEIRQTEIRSKLSGLPAAKRVAAIARSIERGDDSVAASVLNVDRLMSDFLSDLEVERVRSLWAQTRHPDDVARLAVLETDLEHIERTGNILISYQRACAGPSVVPPPATGSTVVIRGTGPAPVNRALAR